MFLLLVHHYTIFEWQHPYPCTEQTLVHRNYKTWAHAWHKLNMEIHEDISQREPSTGLQTCDNATKQKANAVFNSGRVDKTIPISHTSKKGWLWGRWWNVVIANVPPCRKPSDGQERKHMCNDCYTTQSGTQQQRQNPTNWSETGVGKELWEQGDSSTKLEKYHMTEGDGDWKVSQTLKHVVGCARVSVEPACGSTTTIHVCMNTVTGSKQMENFWILSNKDNWWLR